MSDGFILDSGLLTRVSYKLPPNGKKYLNLNDSLKGRYGYRPAGVKFALAPLEKKSVHYKYGGRGYIAGEGEGIVTVNGAPASRRIYLFVRRTMQCIADRWSAEDGTYRFEKLNEDEEYLMVAVDYKKQYEPVSYDYIQPYVGGSD